MKLEVLKIEVIGFLYGKLFILILMKVKYKEIFFWFFLSLILFLGLFKLCNIELINFLLFFIIRLLMDLIDFISIILCCLKIKK